MNNVNLVGRLTKDPEQRYTQNNVAVCGFTLAVNRRFKQEGQQDADFFPVVAWQKTAEFCGKYFNKGQQVWVSGRLQTRNWEDDQGVKHYVTEIVAEEVGFADSKKEGGQVAPAQQQDAGHQTPPPQNQQQSPPKQQGASQGGGQQQGQQPPAGKMPWE